MATARDKQFANMLAELARSDVRRELDVMLESPPAPPDFLDRNFPEQCAFIEDPSKLKVVLCTRRSGKSFGDGLYLFKEAYENPGCSVAYFGLTRQSAKNVMWKDVLTVINKKFRIGAVPNLSELSWTLPNGSVIYLFGVDSSEDEMRKVFGQKFKLAIIDEGALYTIDLRSLVYSVLQPAMIDGDGTICITGMPSDLRRGLFFQLTQDMVKGYNEDAESDGFTPDETDEDEELTFDFTWSEDRRRWTVLDRAEGDEWSGHFWTAYENPHTRVKWAEKIEKKKANNPRIEETPIFQKEWLGKWVVDSDKYVYKYDAFRNTFDVLPDLDGRWNYVLGVDLGHEDDSAFVVLAYHAHDPNAYILESWSKKKMDITDVANRIKVMSMRYDFEAIVVDGSNKMAVEEMKKRHDLWGIQAVQKKYKVGSSRRAKANVIEVMNGDFALGRIKVHSQRCKSLIGEYQNLIWDDRANGLGPRQEHPRCPNHNCFVAGTLVRTEHGERPIESLKPGDLVWTREGLRPVVVGWQSGIEPIWTLETTAGTLRGTHDHPVWTKHQGWTYLSDLEPGNEVIAWSDSAPVPGRVLAVKPPASGSENEPVFALSVYGVHEYFANDVLVSNCDAAFYAWLSVHSYLSTVVEDAPQPGTSEWYAQEARDLEQRDSDRFERHARDAEAALFDDFENGNATVIDLAQHWSN